MPYVYAVTEAAAPIPAPPRYALARGDLAAVVADHDAPEPTAEALLAHEAVVEELMEDGPLLPMRFGSVSADVVALLAERGDELRAALERVRGAIELGVRMGAPDRPAASGTEYLMRRVAVERVHEPLAELARAAVPGTRAPHVGAYLVARADVGRFRTRVAELGDDLVCTGPWPPYSFAG